jgi:hypothetical protein
MDAIQADDPPTHSREAWRGLLIVAFLIFSSVVVALMVAPR